MTHRGAVRENNEDALVIGPFTICGVTQQEPAVCELSLSSPVLIAVADGMGGHAAGELAAAHTVLSLAAAPPQNDGDVKDTLNRIDSELLTMARENPAAADLGTTIAGVLLTPAGGIHFGAGDSRIYAHSTGYLAQISTDDRGPCGGLTQCLGGRADGSPLRTTIEPLPTADRLLLCSDGVSDLIPLETMEDLLNTPGPPTRTTKSLWTTAMNASGRDNITVVLVDFMDHTTTPHGEHR
jgi:PPM family protein phosphatase